MRYRELVFLQGRQCSRDCGHVQRGSPEVLAGHWLTSNVTSTVLHSAVAYQPNHISPEDGGTLAAALGPEAGDDASGLDEDSYPVDAGQDLDAEGATAAAEAPSGPEAICLKRSQGNARIHEGLGDSKS